MIDQSTSHGKTSTEVGGNYAKTAALAALDKNLGSTSRQFDIPLFSLVALLVFFIFGLSIFSLYAQRKNYDRAIAVALEGKTDLNHSIILGYSRAWDFAVVKTSSLFLAFLLIFAGALYVLRSIESGFYLSVDGAKYAGTLSTSSPGLVMITLGVVLVTVTIFDESTVTYQPPSQDFVSDERGDGESQIIQGAMKGETTVLEAFGSTDEDDSQGTKQNIIESEAEENN